MVGNDDWLVRGNAGVLIGCVYLKPICRVGHDITASWESMVSLVDIASGLWPYAHNASSNLGDGGGWWNDLDMCVNGEHQHTFQHSILYDCLNNVSRIECLHSSVITIWAMYRARSIIALAAILFFPTNSM